MRFIKGLIAFLVLFFFASDASALVSKDNYCMVPPFLSSGVKPNVLMVMDYSGSMQFPAYLPCDFGGYNSQHAADCGSSSSASSNYNASKVYYGYFDENKCYTVSSGRFQESANTSCVASKIGTSTYISGNLLNWITTTRMDAARTVLTGGRVNASGHKESEGSEYTFIDNTLHCNFTIATPGQPSNRQLTVTDSGGTCPLGNGTLNAVEVRVVGAATPTGVIDETFGKINYEFMMFNASSGNKGLMKAAKDATLSSLKGAINNEEPYNGTPTGEALWEAYDYLKQSDDHAYVANSSHINKGNGLKDPYYDGTGAGSLPLPCRTSYILLISDGAWNGDVDPVIPAHVIRTTDLRTEAAFPGNQTTMTFAVYAFGDRDPVFAAQGSQAMRTVSMFGSFTDADANNFPYPFTGYNASATGDCGATYDNSQRSSITTSTNTYCNSRSISLFGANNKLSVCDPSGTFNAGCYEWDEDANGVPDTFYQADNPDELRDAIIKAIYDMLRRASSGTAASILSSSEGVGANMLQAVFYPKRVFTNKEIDWTGSLQNLWYAIDPYLQFSSIREDTDANYLLQLANDYKIEYYFDVAGNQTKVRRYRDSDGDGKAGTAIVDTDSPADNVSIPPDKALEDIIPLWEAGRRLHARNLATSDRTIYANIPGGASLSGSHYIPDFSSTNSSLLCGYILQQASCTAADIANANKIISFVRGTDQSGANLVIDTTGNTGFRNRTVDFKGATNPWRLGDIITSTPRIQGGTRLNTYHLEPPSGYEDMTYNSFIQSLDYRSRGAVYVGANDGMLHSFKLGLLDENIPGAKAKLCDDTNANAKCETGEGSGTLGDEQWAFIPKNVLPYLGYMTDPGYCHVYTVDAPVFLFDASINKPTGCASANYWDCDKAAGINSSNRQVLSDSSWRTLLLGGMGLGGGCRTAASACTDCVKTPLLSEGYSSYFALDVTEPAKPRLLWEFTNEQLGFSTTGASIVRIGNKTKNGKWFAVVASGPTGPIDTLNDQFLGRSDQNLRLFILDLTTGTLVRTIDTGIANAFAGSITGTTFDADRYDKMNAGFYSDDAVYVGYVRKSGTTWTEGGILRLITKESDDPSTWVVSTVIDGIGPVTATVVKAQDRANKKMWLYAGSGRFYYKTTTSVDDDSSQRRIYGIQEPCYTTTNDLDPACTASVSLSDLKNQTTTPSATLSGTDKGWYINLDGVTSLLKAERVITDPVVAPSGTVFFVSFAPKVDVCSLGGTTYVWAVNYATGANPTYLSGQATMQISSGEVKEMKLSSIFTAKSGRRTGGGFDGIPPQKAGISIMVNPKPIKKVLHMQER